MTAVTKHVQVNKRFLTERTMTRTVLLADGGGAVSAAAGAAAGAAAAAGSGWGSSNSDGGRGRAGCTQKIVFVCFPSVCEAREGAEWGAPSPNNKRAGEGHSISFLPTPLSLSLSLSFSHSLSVSLSLCVCYADVRNSDDVMHNEAGSSAADAIDLTLDDEDVGGSAARSRNARDKRKRRNWRAYDGPGGGGGGRGKVAGFIDLTEDDDDTAAGGSGSSGAGGGRGSSGAGGGHDSSIADDEAFARQLQAEEDARSKRRRD